MIEFRGLKKSFGEQVVLNGVDLLVPESYRVLVKKGDRLKNGATPVAVPEKGEKGAR